MASYEKVKDGAVVETVHALPNSYSDNELGALAVDYGGGDGWRPEGWTPPVPLEKPKPAPPAREKNTKEA